MLWLHSSSLQSSPVWCAKDLQHFADEPVQRQIEWANKLDVINHHSVASLLGFCTTGCEGSGRLLAFSNSTFSSTWITVMSPWRDKSSGVLKCWCLVQPPFYLNENWTIRPLKKVDRWRCYSNSMLAHTSLSQQFDNEAPESNGTLYLAICTSDH